MLVLPFPASLLGCAGRSPISQSGLSVAGEDGQESRTGPLGCFNQQLIVICLCATLRNKNIKLYTIINLKSIMLFIIKYKAL